MVGLDNLALVSQVVDLELENEHDIFPNNDEIPNLLNNVGSIHTPKLMDIESSSYSTKKIYNKTKSYSLWTH